MKKYNSLQSLLPIVKLAVALTLFPRCTVAENKPPVPAGSAQLGYAIEITDGKLVSAMNGRGAEATLGNVVDALRDRYTTANMVLSPGLAKLKISDLKLRAGRLTDELEAIRVASGAKFDWMGPGSAGPNLPPESTWTDPTTGLPVAATATQPNTGLFVLREPTPTPETERTVEAFNIGPYLQWLREKQDPKEGQDLREQQVAKSLDELLKIIVVTLDSLKPGSSVEAPNFRFHQGANLLVVVGTREAVDVARKVVNALPEQAGLLHAESSTPGGFGVPGMSLDMRKRYGLSPGTGAAPAPTQSQ